MHTQTSVILSTLALLLVTYLSLTRAEGTWRPQGRFGKRSAPTQPEGDVVILSCFVGFHIYNLDNITLIISIGIKITIWRYINLVISKLNKMHGKRTRGCTFWCGTSCASFCQ